MVQCVKQPSIIQSIRYRFYCAPQLIIVKKARCNILLMMAAADRFVVICSGGRRIFSRALFKRLRVCLIRAPLNAIVCLVAVCGCAPLWCPSIGSFFLYWPRRHIAMFHRTHHFLFNSLFSKWLLAISLVVTCIISLLLFCDNSNIWQIKW